jgi:hypothetical protein
MHQVGFPLHDHIELNYQQNTTRDSVAPDTASHTEYYWNQHALLEFAWRSCGKQRSLQASENS